MEKGYLMMVLHAHLPFVRHPEHEHFMEEDWLFEAITETYLPLLMNFNKCVDDGVDFRLTMTMTPSLLAMLSDGLLQTRYLNHLDKLIELTEKEIIRTTWDEPFNKLAYMYNEKFCKARKVFAEDYGCNIVHGFKTLQDLGKLDIITCGATHGFFPNMDSVKTSVKAQVEVAVKDYQRYFGCSPQGIWLPECGYCPGDDRILKDYGIRYFFTDTHGIMHGTPRPKYGVFAPVYCPSGVACFSRDVESSKQVWSSIEGYPGDYNYREFYRDIGFDLDFEYIKPYIHKDGIRMNTGIKYFKITGKDCAKEAYIPENAANAAASHAGNFMFNRQKQVDHLNSVFGGRKPVIVSPYDAELFGHWWYEGPMWLDYLIRKIYCDQDTIRMVTPKEYLGENPENQVIQPSFSTWGHKGYAEVWLDDCNDWMYRHLHQASERMTELAKKYYHSDGDYARACNQAARELLLAESSDWAFILSTGTVCEYAVKRMKDHVHRFTKLYNDLKNGYIDHEWLSEVEARDNLFPEIDFRVYASTDV